MDWGLLLPAALPVLFWILIALDPARRFPRECVLPRAEDEPTAESAGPVVAVVPARDEAAMLPRTLPTLLSQRALDEVLLIDDGSGDGTAETARRVARELAGESGATVPLTIHTLDRKPEGWAGKVYAMAEGESLARRRGAGWILFTDADIAHRPGSVASLLQRTHGGYDLVSVMARLQVQSVWEKALIPVFVFYFHLLYPFRRVKQAWSSVAAAAGGCVLVRTRALEKSGGVAAIRNALIDDVALARSIKEAGFGTWLGFDDGIVSQRPYETLSELGRMISRSAFVQLDRRVSLVVLTVLALALLVVSPPVWIALSYAWPPGAAWGALSWVFQAALLLPFVRQQRAPLWAALTLPFASVFYGAMTVVSAWNDLRGAGTRWKGRLY
ncbi:hypothetical protein ABI59_23165 [Acidobacteria bacterium Mor1]|nr:hypothetical protein ABI59_23165 [Acidobacteria bacterium Mor1]